MRRPHILRELARRVLLVAIAMCMALGGQFLYLGKSAHAEGWLIPWQQRQAITLNNTGGELSNYQTKITLTAANFNFATAQPGGNDLRVTSGDGTTVLPFWVESYNATAQTATIWVKVPVIAANTTTLYLYSGNPLAAAVSSGANTFPFFDDFTNLSWKELQNLPYKTADESAVVVQGKIYIIGGYNNTSTNPLTTTYQFDPAAPASANPYTKKDDLNYARWGLIAMNIGDKIYAFGGRGPAYSAVGVTEVFNPANDTWTTKPKALPANITDQGLTGCSDGTYGYLFYNGFGWRYNPTNDTYTALTTLPTQQSALSWASCSYDNGKLYLIGGYRNGAINLTKIYNLSTGVWSTGAPLPFAMYGSLRENPVINGNIYVVQGQRNDSEFSSGVYRYNIATNTWTQKSFGPHAADGVAGGVVNGKIYTFGGRQDGTGPYGTPYAAVYDPAADTNQNWQEITGNFEVSGGKLHRLVPPQGDLSANPYFFSQINSTYSTTGNFVLEAQGTQTANGWNTIAVRNSNNGLYNSNLTGYLAPYNDYGVSPNVTQIYRENGTSYTSLASGAAATGTQRFKVVNTSGTNGKIALHRNNSATPTMQTTGTAASQYQNGRISMITSAASTASWDFMFVRTYAATEPIVSIDPVVGNPTVPDPPTQPAPAPIPVASFSVWPSTATPAGSETENTGYELGSRFYSDVPGKITALRFYKSGNPGAANVHTLRLWDAAGNLLATATTANETASGWQTATLPQGTEVAISAGQPYIATYIIGAGHPYAINVSQLANAGVSNPDTPLHLYQDGAAGPSGPFRVGTGFPNQSWSSSNYWSDVVFTPNS